MPLASALAIDAPAVVAAARSRLEPHPHQARLAGAYLATLTPERWTIEWHLPSWLAARLGLADDVANALTESNVLGLLSVRLSDDVVDGDVDPFDVAAAEALAAAALDAALCPYRELFPPGSPFWPFLEGSMAAWRAGADGPDHGARTAPIRIAAYACCLLAGQPDLWPLLERCLERAMTALVLYDQFFDWEADVEAGRWNAFVAGILDRAPTAGRAQGRVRSAVLAAMLAEDVVPGHFARIAAEATTGARLAEELELGELAGHLRSWARAAAVQGDDIAAHYRGAADQATRLLFSRAPGAYTGGGQR
jgi:hypothetical protein